MNSALYDIAVTIVSPLFSLALFLIATRFLAQLTGVSSHNPISVGLRKVTDPVVRPINRLVPSGKRVSLGALIALIGCQVVFIAVVFALDGRIDLLNIAQAFIWSALAAVGLLVDLIFYAVLGIIIISFLAPQSSHPAVTFIWQLTEPVMAPLRQVIPPMGGLDFSPIILFIGINVIRVSLGHMAVATGMPAFVIGI